MQGLSSAKVAKLQAEFGLNTFEEEEKGGQRTRAFLARFKNPLVIILLTAAVISLFFGDEASAFIIFAIVFLSVVLDFVNTYRSQAAAEALRARVRVLADVIRNGRDEQVPVTEIVPGDIIRLRAGKIVPADGVIIESSSLFANESALTGESFPQAKDVRAEVFMGSGIVSGEGLMRVVTTGNKTKFAHIVSALQSRHLDTEFEREIKDFSVLIIKITFALVIFVFLVNILLHRNILESVLFSLALAVGLTPELLPLIITLNLTKGSLRMAREGVIVKQLSAIQNFGSMDVLCTDKTGTLTENKIVLVRYVDGKGEKSESVLRWGRLISVFSTGFANPLDEAVRNFHHISVSEYQKIDEVPFDFERKRQAVIVHHSGQKRRFLVSMGAPEEMFKIIKTYLETDHKITDKTLETFKKTYETLSKDGFRVLAVASKEIDTKKRYQRGDEAGLTFQGFLAFLDPAKATVAPTLELLEKMGVSIKIITGDNALVTQKIASDIGLLVGGVLTGEQIQKLHDRQLALEVDKTTLFTRVNPEQKMRIIRALQSNGHIVGYLGDGINDAPSLRAADVGVSVNNAVDVARDAADFILLRKNLHELANGIVEGRKTFANTMKYLRMGLSSNFGNMFSMAGASLFLPFLPLLATQILLNNLLYDTSQLALPLDNVDDQDIQKPHKLSLGGIERFMWSYGLLSSIFDFATFGALLLIFHADAQTFRAGWFLESMLTQVLVVYVIRTRMLPFGKNKPNLTLVLITLLVLVAATLFVTLPIRHLFNFGDLHLAEILSLGALVSVYLIIAQLIKNKLYQTGENSL